MTGMMGCMIVNALFPLQLVPAARDFGDVVHVYVFLIGGPDSRGLTPAGPDGVSADVFNLVMKVKLGLLLHV